MIPSHIFRARVMAMRKFDEIYEKYRARGNQFNAAI